MNDDTNQFQTFVIENNYRIIKRRNKISLWSNNRIRNFIWKLCKSNSSERFTQNCRLIVILCAESRHNTTDLSRMWMSNEVCVWGSKIPLLHHNMKIRLILTSHIIKVYLDKNCNDHADPVINNEPPNSMTWLLWWVKQTNECFSF